MVPWLVVGLIGFVLLLVFAVLALLGCSRRRARRRARRTERFVFLELHEAELKDADAVCLRALDGQFVAVSYVFGERVQEQNRAPMHFWPDVVAEISLLSTRSLKTPPRPGMTLCIAGLATPWVVSVCEPDRQIRLVRQTADK